VQMGEYCLSLYDAVVDHLTDKAFVGPSF
jgi:hypothetical protein